VACDNSRTFAKWNTIDFIDKEHFKFTEGETTISIQKVLFYLHFFSHLHVKQKGRYFFSCRLNLQAQYYWCVEVLKNGNQLAVDYYSTTNQLTFYSISEVFEFNIGDKLQIRPSFQKIITGTASQSCWSMFYLGDI